MDVGVQIAALLGLLVLSLWVASIGRRVAALEKRGSRLAQPPVASTSGHEPFAPILARYLEVAGRPGRAAEERAETGTGEGLPAPGAPGTPVSQAAPAGASQAPPPVASHALLQEVVALSRSGLDATSIGSRLAMPRGEVEVLLGLARARGLVEKA